MGSASSRRSRTTPRSPVPDSTDPIHAAAMLVTYQTSHVALFRRANLRPGEWVLVHGGAGGVGTAAIQLAKRAGARGHCHCWRRREAPCM